MILKNHDVVPFLHHKLLEALSIPLEGHTRTVRLAVDNSRGNTIVTASDDGTARLWTGESCEAILEGHDGAVTSAVFNSTGDMVVTASRDGTAKIWQCRNRTWHCQATLRGHKSTVWTATFNGRGDRVVTASADGTVKVWQGDLDDWSCEETLAWDEGPVVSAVFNSSGNNIVAMSWDRTAKIWKRDQGTWQREASLEHDAMVTSAVFNRAGDKVVTTSKDGTAKIWTDDQERGWLCEAILADHACPVVSAVFDRAGKRVVTASEDGTAKVWVCNPAGWSCEATLDVCMNMMAGGTSVSFNAGGDKIVVSSWTHKRAQVWTGTAKKGWTREIVFGDPLDVQSATFDSSSDNVIISFTNGSVQLCDVERFLVIARCLKRDLLLEQALLLICIHQEHVQGKRFDFTRCRSWEKHFDMLPEEIKRQLDPHALN